MASIMDDSEFMPVWDTMKGPPGLEAPPGLEDFSPGQSTVAPLTPPGVFQEFPEPSDFELDLQAPLAGPLLSTSAPLSTAAAVFDPYQSMLDMQAYYEGMAFAEAQTYAAQTAAWNTPSFNPYAAALSPAVSPDKKPQWKAEPMRCSAFGANAEKVKQLFAPKKRDLVTQYSTHNGPVVTLMIRDIPCRITQQQLIDAIDDLGFKGKYDFLYLPTGGRSSAVGSSNLGYGFINFSAASDVDPFMKAFGGYQFDGTSSTKVCTVKPAHIQGLENNIIHFDRTAAKGRPRREEPYIRLPTTEPQNIRMEDLSSCRMEEPSYLTASHLDSLEALCA